MPTRPVEPVPVPKGLEPTPTKQEQRSLDALVRKTAELLEDEPGLDQTSAMRRAEEWLKADFGCAQGFIVRQQAYIRAKGQHDYEHSDPHEYPPPDSTDPRGVLIRPSRMTEGHFALHAALGVNDVPLIGAAGRRGKLDEYEPHTHRDDGMVDWVIRDTSSPPIAERMGTDNAAELERLKARVAVLEGSHGA
jgi:hypothetical protein